MEFTKNTVNSLSNQNQTPRLLFVNEELDIVPLVGNAGNLVGLVRIISGVDGNFPLFSGE